jgi:hypothetical protein
VKIKFPKNTAKSAPASIPQNDPAVKIPASLKKFEGKNPNDEIKKIILKLVPNDAGATNALAGVFSAMCDTGLDVPEWAKRASQKLFEASGLDFMANFGADMNLVQFSRIFGKIVGLAEKSLKNPKPEASIGRKMEKKLAAPFVKFSKSLASEAEPEESEAFFSGRNESEELVEKMQQPTQRTKIYLVIALHWQIVQKFSSTGEFYKWLLSMKDPKGNNLIVPNTDSREIRKICQSIGLEFQNQWQKSKIPATVSDDKAGIVAPPQSRP